jgi:hypothetical protein
VSLLIRHTAVWTGVPGLPGYSQFYQEVTGTIASQAQNGHNAIRAAFNQVVTLLPADIDVTVDPVYQVMTVESGEVTTEDSVATPSAVVSGGFVSGWSGQVGVLVEWLTGQFIDGRRLRGRTYLVPLGNAYDDDGTLPIGTLNAVGAFALQLWSAGLDFVVWHRPVAGAGGSLATITDAAVRDHAAILRSRRV